MFTKRLRGPVMAGLERVVHAVSDLDAGLRLFAGLLRGSEIDAGADESSRWVELSWLTPPLLRNRATRLPPGGRPHYPRRRVTSAPGISDAASSALATSSNTPQLRAWPLPLGARPLRTWERTSWTTLRMSSSVTCMCECLLIHRRDRGERRGEFMMSLFSLRSLRPPR